MDRISSNSIAVLATCAVDSLEPALQQLQNVTQIPPPSFTWGNYAAIQALADDPDPTYTQSLPAELLHAASCPASIWVARLEDLTCAHPEIASALPTAATKARSILKRVKARGLKRARDASKGCSSAAVPGDEETALSRQTDTFTLLRALAHPPPTDAMLPMLTQGAERLLHGMLRWSERATNCRQHLLLLAPPSPVITPQDDRGHISAAVHACMLLVCCALGAGAVESSTAARCSAPALNTDIPLVTLPGWPQHVPGVGSVRVELGATGDRAVSTIASFRCHLHTRLDLLHAAWQQGAPMEHDGRCSSDSEGDAAAPSSPCDTPLTSFQCKLSLAIPSHPTAQAWLSSRPLAPWRITSPWHLLGMAHGSIPRAFAPIPALLAHAPMSPALVHASATHISRWLAARACPTRKLLVLDCDGTLWQGVVGEDGPAGVRPERFAGLWHWAAARKAEGWLLALASRNIRSDVEAVFQHHAGKLPLAWADFVSVEVNWTAKATGLQRMLQTLRLGAEALVFIDDNPVEVAAAQAALPACAALHWPSDLSEQQQQLEWLQHAWCFDAPVSASGRAFTTADADRAAVYATESSRQAELAQAASVSAFLASLNVRVAWQVNDASAADRLAQLTLRTNQMNVRKVPVSTAEVQRRCADPAWLVAGGTATDRFGCYGLVLAVMARLAAVPFHVPPAAGAASTAARARAVAIGHPAAGELVLQVDTLLMSCRCLHRGVEHIALHFLAKHAREAGAAWLALPWEPTERNEPAAHFLFTECAAEAKFWPDVSMADGDDDADGELAAVHLEEHYGLLDAAPADASQCRAGARCTRVHDAEHMTTLRHDALKAFLEARRAGGAALTAEQRLEARARADRDFLGAAPVELTDKPVAGTLYIPVTAAASVQLTRSALEPGLADHVTQRKSHPAGQPAEHAAGAAALVGSLAPAALGSAARPGDLSFVLPPASARALRSSGSTVLHGQVYSMVARACLSSAGLAALCTARALDEPVYWCESDAGESAAARANAAMLALEPLQRAGIFSESSTDSSLLLQRVQKLWSSSMGAEVDAEAEVLVALQHGVKSAIAGGTKVADPGAIVTAGEVHAIGLELDDDDVDKLTANALHELQSKFRRKMRVEAKSLALGIMPSDSE